eukprot:GHVO01013186.1.p1 GENE.GHVO01013186.1~~GHVO01013186.1.p1  ORF type:complete len:322 (+),score=63.13 GHVO01013186.1:460-1425(+)
MCIIFLHVCNVYLYICICPPVHILKAWTLALTAVTDMKRAPIEFWKSMKTVCELDIGMIKSVAAIVNIDSVKIVIDEELKCADAAIDNFNKHFEFDGTTKKTNLYIPKKADGTKSDDKVTKHGVQSMKSMLEGMDGILHTKLRENASKRDGAEPSVIIKQYFKQFKDEMALSITDLKKNDLLLGVLQKVSSSDYGVKPMLELEGIENVPSQIDDDIEEKVYLYMSLLYAEETVMAEAKGTDFDPDLLKNLVSPSAIELAEKYGSSRRFRALRLKKEDDMDEYKRLVSKEGRDRCKISRDSDYDSEFIDTMERYGFRDIPLK